MRIFNLSKKTGNLSSNDFFGVDNGSTVNKIDYNALAKAIIEQYTGSSLAGSAQSVKAALDALNSKMSGIAFSKATVSTVAKTFTLGVNYRGTLFVYDSSPPRNGIYMVYSTGSGVVEMKAISAASDITIDTSVASEITFTAPSGTRIIVFLTTQGNVPAQRN